MGYITPETLPFVNSLAATFPVCDRWFCSVGAQTYPNRRFFMAGTSLGLTVDVLNDDVAAERDHLPGARRPRHHLEELLLVAPVVADLVVPEPALPGFSSHLVKDDQFFVDAAAGTLPSVSLVDPNFSTTSEEDPQDVQYGDQFLLQGRERRDGLAPVGAHAAGLDL